MLQPEYEVVGVVTDGRSLLRTAVEVRPDAVIIEASMPQLNGLDAAEQIKRTVPAAKIMFLTMNSDPDLASEAFRRGASGYILKQSGAEEFLSAIRRVMNGHSYLSPLIARETITHLLHRRQANNHKKISCRQSEVLQLLAEGRTMKEIASILDITPGTVALHKYNMMEKLGVTTNAGLLLYALQNHMIPAQKTA